MCVVFGSFIHHRDSWLTVLVGQNYSHMFNHFFFGSMVWHMSGTQIWPKPFVSMFVELKLSLYIIGVTQSDDEARQPAFALAVRGPRAFSLLKDITGSLSPLLPKKTDPISDSQGQKPAFFCSPRLASEVHTGLCLWFSGRLQGGTAQNHNQQLKRFFC